MCIISGNRRDRVRLVAGIRLARFVLYRGHRLMESSLDTGVAMKRGLKAILILAVLACGTPPGFAQEASALSSAMERATREESQVLEQQVQLHAAMTGLQGMLERIDQLKQDDSPSVADVLRLQSLLREADIRLSEVERLDLQVRASLAAWQTLSAGVVSEVRAEREALLVEGATLWLQDRDLNEELAQLERVEVRFTAPELERQALPLQSIRASLTQTPEELAATADELADEASRLQRQMDELAVREADAERRERLQQRSREMLFDETFFEDSASRRAPARNPQSGDSTSNAVPQLQPGGEERGPTTSGDSMNDADDALASGAMDGVAAPEFGSPEEGAPVEPSDSLSGGFDAVARSPELAPVVFVPFEQAGAAADPTLLRNDVEAGALPRGRTRAADLRAQRALLQRQLEAVADERTRLLNEADALQNEVR